MVELPGAPRRVVVDGRGGQWGRGTGAIEPEAAEEQHQVEVGGGDEGDNGRVALGVVHRHDGVEGEQGQQQSKVHPGEAA